jgi:hypothetical protein
MKLGAGRSQLYSALKTCSEHWEHVRPAWRDVVARQFEEDCLVPLQQQVKGVLHAIDRLSGVLEQMQRDCE